MTNIINLLNNTSTLPIGNIGGCKCNSNSSAFDLIMVSLLKAVANKNEIADSISNNITNDLDTKNLSHNTSKIESSINDININNRIDKAIDDASKKYNIDENLIRSIIKVESNFNPNVVSSAGAKGLMQLMPQNCKALGVTDPFDIEQNIDAGTRHIKEYIDKYNGNIEMGLMAYNGGPTRMAKRGVTSPEHIYKMPKETQNYVPKVMKYYRG